MSPLRLLRTLLIVAAALALGACRPQGPWQLNRIDGLMPDLSFAMTDDRGRPVSAEDYRGKPVLLFFGYTSCPDVCASTLARLAGAIGQVPGGPDAVTVLFVSVDPSRDSAERLRRYVGVFGPEFIGLRGSDDALDALVRRYRVTYAYGKPDADGQYDVIHSSGVFIFDGQGRARLLAGPNDWSAPIAADLKRLLEGARTPPAS
ncbi:SCO family protein [Nitrogeniibacter mangrovi]|uniref:SCO family protein n=1 Tax=Nitrogeniibacter mangrovi TaxID=2016596 RepID=A0A6C1B5T5_9RHOO|nr:SCO family protein [Nitrogeniibacter mangrovi]QID18827.1 SCO family protein [Nitrogeniibacter mangrovi]